jgi:hypothetical protein
MGRSAAIAFALRFIDQRSSRQFIGPENVFGYGAIVKVDLPAHYPYSQ